MKIKGGDKLAKALNALARKFNIAGVLQVGFLENAKYPDGTSVAMVAAIHNYGAPKAGIPPRPFFTNMIKEKSPGWPKALATNLVANNYDVDLTFRQMGEGIQGQLQDSILNGDWTPLKPATVAAKGFDKPLVDTSHMINSVAYVIAAKEDK